MNAKTLFLAGSAVLVVSAMTFGGSLQAPPGLFKDLNDEILGDAIILNGKQLFIDDYIIDELSGAEKVMNQTVKHEVVAPHVISIRRTQPNTRAVIEP